MAKQAEEQAAERERQEKERLQMVVEKVLAVVESAADGDLSQRINLDGDDEFGKLAAGIDRMIADLRYIIGQVVDSGMQFAEGAAVIAAAPSMALIYGWPGRVSTRLL